jgi:hypothetical protein
MSKKERDYKNKVAFKNFLSLKTDEVMKLRREFNLFANNFTDQKIEE